MVSGQARFKFRHEFDAKEVAMRTFEEMFCEHYHYPKREFARQLFSRSLFLQARPVADVLYWIQCPVMERLLERAALVSSERELRGWIAEYEREVDEWLRPWAKR